MQKKFHFGEVFLKTEACGQTVLPDMSVLIGPILVEMPNLNDANETFQAIFQQCGIGK